MILRDRKLQTGRRGKELATLEADLYNNRDKTSHESTRVSRDNRLVALGPKDVTSRANSTPEQNAQAAEIAKSFRVIITIQRSCLKCGQRLPGEGKKKNMIWAVEGDGSPPVESPLCRSCFVALGINLEPDDWFSKLPVLDHKIWRLNDDGLTQRQIAARLTNGTQRVTQQRVSETLQRIKRQINQSRQNRYGSQSQ